MVRHISRYDVEHIWKHKEWYKKSFFYTNTMKVLLLTCRYDVENTGGLLPADHVASIAEYRPIFKLEKYQINFEKCQK